MDNLCSTPLGEAVLLFRVIGEEAGMVFFDLILLRLAWPLGNSRVNPVRTALWTMVVWLFFRLLMVERWGALFFFFTGYIYNSSVFVVRELFGTV